MCIIVISENAPLTLADFQDFHRYNEDGAGIMVAENGKVNVHVTLDGPEQVYAKYITMYRAGIPSFIHYRMKTHGNIDLANAHPYLVYTWPDGRELWMMHNGILHTGNKANVAMSDTWHFIQERLQKLCEEYPKWYMNVDLLEWLGDFIGNNRFVFLDSDGDYAIVNYTQWTTHNKHLYSNTYAWSSPVKMAPKKPYPSYLNAPVAGSTMTGAHGMDTTKYPLANQHLYPSFSYPNDGYDYVDSDWPASYKHLDDVESAADDVYGADLAYYNGWASDINTMLPLNCQRSWGYKDAEALEYEVDLDLFLFRLENSVYAPDECDRIVELLRAITPTPDMTNELYMFLHSSVVDIDYDALANNVETVSFEADLQAGDNGDTAVVILDAAKAKRHTK